MLGALRDLGLEDPAAVYVEAIEALLQAAPSACLNLPGGRLVQREYDLLSFTPARIPETLPEQALSIPGTTTLPDGLGKLECFVTKNSNFSQKNLTTFALKYDMIAQHGLRVRGRRPGDRLTLSGGTKSVKALMIDRKIPARMRDAVPILVLNGSPIAVFGVGSDPAYYVKPDEDALVVSYVPSP